MTLEGKRVGLCLTGSFCNFFRVSETIERIKKEGATVIPIVSNSVLKESTRFFKNNEFLKMVKNFSEHEIIDSIVSAEPLGPRNMVDIMFICPCTGNTIGKLANSIVDTPVLMAVKGHLRNNKPVVIGISTNDGLGNNLSNIGNLLNRKNIFFVPFFQDDHIHKPKSLVLDYSYIIEALEKGLDYEQIQPILSKQ